MNKSHRVAATIIVGDNSQTKLEKCMDSLIPYCQGIFIHFNGKTDLKAWSKELAEKIIASGTEVVVKKFKWEDDFSLARTQNFMMVPVDRYDWYFWIDSDDTLVNGENIQSMLDSLNQFTTGVFLKYDYLVDDDNNPLVEQWRERFLSTKCAWHWQYPIHETCHGRPGTQYARKTEVVVRHHRKDGPQSEETRIRNRRILAKARKQFPDIPRFLYYFGNELYAEANSMEESPERDEALEGAIAIYAEFINKTDFDDDAYMANCNMADCQRMLNEFNKAIDIDLQGVKLYPSWPTAYIGICKSCMNMGEWDKMFYWADIAIQHARHPQTTQVHEPLNVDFSPYVLRGIANEELGKLEESIADFERAKEIQPKNEFILEKLDTLRTKLKDRPILDEGEEKLWRQQRKLLFGSNKHKSICFVTRPLFEPWHSQYFLEGRGTGGAELCVTQIANYFAQDGWRTVIFGTPGNWPGTDLSGIEWYPSTEWDANEEFTITVSSRAPEIFDADVKSQKKILWMHDVNAGDELGTSEWGNRVDNIDHILGLTNWHVNHMSMLYNIPKEKMAVVPNGVNLARYEKWAEHEKHENRFVYSSSPDRGLDVAIRIWPEIKELIPDAEIHIYYGWEAIDKIITQGGKPAQHLLEFKMHLEGAIEHMGREEYGIFWHDRVGQDELAKAQMEAAYWLYPTFFCETFCITAIESQAAGLIPITSELAGLKETVGMRELKINGWPNNTDYVKRYLELLKNVTSMSQNEKTIVRHQGRRFAENFTWGNSFRKWKELTG